MNNNMEYGFEQTVSHEQKITMIKENHAVI